MFLFSDVGPDEENCDDDEDSSTVANDKIDFPFGHCRRIPENIFQRDVNYFKSVIQRL